MEITDFFFERDLIRLHEYDWSDKVGREAFWCLSERRSKLHFENGRALRYIEFIKRYLEARIRYSLIISDLAKSKMDLTLALKDYESLLLTACKSPITSDTYEYYSKETRFRRFIKLTDHFQARNAIITTRILNLPSLTEIGDEHLFWPKMKFVIKFHKQ